MGRKPWAKIGMSRSSWYRHGKPATRPVKQTEVQYCAENGLKLRTLQRMTRIYRFDPELAKAVANRQLTVRAAEQYLLREIKRIPHPVIFLPDESEDK
jgi:hypothetical protein